MIPATSHDMTVCVLYQYTKCILCTGTYLIGIGPTVNSNSTMGRLLKILTDWYTQELNVWVASTNRSPCIHVYTQVTIKIIILWHTSRYNVWHHTCVIVRSPTTPFGLTSKGFVPLGLQYNTTVCKCGLRSSLRCCKFQNFPGGACFWLPSLSVLPLATISSLW